MTVPDANLLICAVNKYGTAEAGVNPRGSEAIGLPGNGRCVTRSHWRKPSILSTHGWSNQVRGVPDCCASCWNRWEQEEILWRDERIQRPIGSTPSAFTPVAMNCTASAVISMPMMRVSMWIAVSLMRLRTRSAPARKK
jgi:hypothetical protein